MEVVPIKLSSSTLLFNIVSVIGHIFLICDDFASILVIFIVEISDDSPVVISVHLGLAKSVSYLRPALLVKEPNSEKDPKAHDHLQISILELGPLI
jgi:hypothetical protein